MSRILCVATVNLPGLPRGRRVYIDPDRPYERSCLEAEYLLPVEEDDDGEAEGSIQAPALPA